MGILDLFKPKWKHSDPQVRITAIKSFRNDKEVIEEIILNDTDEKVVLEAVNSIDDYSFLEYINEKAVDGSLKTIIESRLNKLYAEAVQKEKDISLISKIQDEQELLTLAVAGGNCGMAALKLLGDEEMFARIARTTKDREIGRKAIQSISNKELLEKVSTSASAKQIKNAAKKRLSELDEAIVDHGHNLQTKLEAIISQAATHEQSVNWPAAHDFFQQTGAQWAELDPENEYPAIKETFMSHYTTFVEREKSHNEIRQAVSEYEQICESVKLLAIEEETVTKLNSLKSQWESGPEIPPEKAEILNKEFEKLCTTLEESLSTFAAQKEQRESALATCTQLCEQIETIAKSESPDLSKLSTIEKEWKTAVTGFEEETSSLAERFTAAYGSLKEQLDTLIAEQQKQEEEFNNQLKTIIAEVEKAQQAENKFDHVNAVKELQTKWKELTKETQNKELYSQFKKACDSFFSDLKTQRETQDLERWENYTRKTDLVEEARLILTKESDLHEVAKKLKALRTSWKEIGPVPREKSDEIWNNFNAACDTAYAACKEFFDKLDADREGNQSKKEELCEKAEALKDSEEWAKTAEALKALQADWKATGPGIKEKDQETYKRFRTACDFFFGRRSENFSARTEKQGENAKVKATLCEEAKAIESKEWIEGSAFAKEMRTKWKEAGHAGKEEESLWTAFNETISAFYAKFDSEKPANLEKKAVLCDTLEKLTGAIDDSTNFKKLGSSIDEVVEAWKTIGPVPEESDKEIYSRYKKAMDIFYKSRSAFYKTLDSARGDNQKIKQELITQLLMVVNLPEKNWKEEGAKVKEIQAQWKQAGPAPKEVDQQLWDQYRELCDAFYGEQKKFFEKLDEKRQKNLSRKVKICVELEKICGTTFEEEEVSTASLAEELKFSIENNFNDQSVLTSRKAAFERIKELQAEWKSVGPVPRENDKELFTRYRAACDTFFADKKDKAPKVEEASAVEVETPEEK